FPVTGWRTWMTSNWSRSRRRCGAGRPCAAEPRTTLAWQPPRFLTSGGATGAPGDRTVWRCGVLRGSALVVLILLAVDAARPGAHVQAQEMQLVPALVGGAAGLAAGGYVAIGI